MKIAQALKRELFTVKWLPILLFLLIWSRRERNSLFREAESDGSIGVYNVWDVVSAQLMHPFLLLWLILPIWLLFGLRSTVESGEPAVQIRAGNEARWLLLLLRRSLPALIVLLGLWLLAIASTLPGVPFSPGWSEFARSDHPWNFFAAAFVREGWSPWSAALMQLLLLALFLLMLTLLLGTLRLYTERASWISVSAAALMIGSIVAYHRQSHYPQWQWASIVNGMLLNNAYGTFGSFWPAFAEAPVVAALCFGLALLRRRRRSRGQALLRHLQGGKAE